MLTQLGIRNFKCFEALSLPLAPLTLLTGFNAAGKSTTIQSLLLITQALRSNNRSRRIDLNGSLVRLGTPSEILNVGSGNLIFSVEDEESSIEWTLGQEKERSRFSMRIQKILLKTSEGIQEYDDNHLQEESLDMLLPPSGEKVRQLVHRLKDIVFLSAVRAGTADVFPSPEYATLINADVGVQGEYAPWWFQEYLDDDIDPARHHPLENGVTLRRQFNAWASNLFPGAQGNVQRIDMTDLIRLELRIGDLGEWCRPANIGYGLTYAFPIIIAGLLAKPGQVLIIDSPEAHLHPLGQSNIAAFLAAVVASGVQVIIETHSDHVLNGVRLSVQKKIIAPDQTAIHFFGSLSAIAPEPSRIVSPLLDSYGNLSEWPEGFFDQSEKDMSKLAGWS